MQLRASMVAVISLNPLARIDYVSVADPDTLAELEVVEDRALFSLAVFVDGVRLIDNLVVG
jgi:pantoate--beta-alanine ligase